MQRVSMGGDGRATPNVVTLMQEGADPTMQVSEILSMDSEPETFFVGSAPYVSKKHTPFRGIFAYCRSFYKVHSPKDEDFACEHHKPLAQPKKVRVGNETKIILKPLQDVCLSENYLA